MISASSGRVLITVLVSGMTRLTNCSTVLRSCGTWSSSSPSAVCTRRGRTPFREPRAWGVRSYRARPRKLATSSSRAFCRTKRAPSRPISATCSASLSPWLSSSLMADSRTVLGATLDFTA